MERYVFKDSGYLYTRVVFNVGDRDIDVSMYGKYMKPLKFRIEDYRNLTAIDIIKRYPEMGRHFEDGIKTIFCKMGLPLGYVHRILRDPYPVIREN